MTSTGKTYRLGYRADIEGLRAIAVLLVVACHAKVPWLAGGFVGVDVFYVLSGYLITGLLVQEISTTGDLRFANFYGRRLRRLLPALLLMLVVICILARLLAPAAGLPEQASTAASAALWLSNFRFAFWHMNYFAPGTETNLFLHTWSLGVEEQFYLVWPLLMVLAMGAWKGAKRPISAGRLNWLFGSIFTISFGLSCYWSSHAPHLAFYMMPSRAWQFSLGALVFLIAGSPAFRTPSVIRNTFWLHVTGWIGLVMILLAALIIDGNVPYPGTWALLPSFGAALLIAAGARGNNGAGDVLSLRPLQALGRVSYAWYLWHWPILLLGAALLDVTNGWNCLLLVLVSLLIAAVSYRFFETPIRRNRRLLAKPRLAVVASLVVMGLACSMALRWHTAAEQRMWSPEQRRLEVVRHNVPVIYNTDCDDYYHSSRVRICVFGDQHATHTAVAIGDSIALEWLPAYRKIFDKPDWRLLVVTKSACPMVDEPSFLTTIGREYTECAQWRKAALRKVAELHPDVVVTGSTFTYAFTQDQWIFGTRRVLQILAGNAKRVYLMRSTPALPFDGPDCLAPRSWLYAALAGALRCTSSAHSRIGDNVYTWLKIAAAPFNNVRFVDMTDNVCPNGVCHAELNGEIVFRDTHHLTASFARSLAPALDKAFTFDNLTAAK